MGSVQHHGAAAVLVVDKPAEEMQKRIQTQIDSNSKEYQAFRKQFSAQPAQVEMAVRFPSLLNISYLCSTLYEMLMLEFTKMLEHGIRFKKCKNCGRYFILKGNYKTDYCDRIPEGETKDCQTIASLKNYRKKAATNTAWLLYNKFYKRYHARMKAGNIDAVFLRNGSTTQRPCVMIAPRAKSPNRIFKIGCTAAFPIKNIFE